MSQNIIDVGSFANDGTGTPLRASFSMINNNFSQIFAAGPVDSNIQIANNTIQSTNLNGNIVMATNGTGVLVTSSDFLPDVGCVRNIGSPGQRFRSIYTQNINTQNQTITGNLAVNGNLYVNGNVTYSNVSNLNISNSQIHLGVGATNPWEVDGGGIYLEGANASITYSAANNSWVSNMTTITQGNIISLGGYFIGDGGLLSNVHASTDAAFLTGNTLSGNVLFSSLQTVGILANLQVANFVAANRYYGNGAGLANITAANVVGIVGNAYFANTANLAYTANLAAIATLAINADNALYALNSANSVNAGFAVNANSAAYANYAFAAELANSAIAATTAQIVTNNNQPYINRVGTLIDLSVSGPAQVASIRTDNYLYANGAPVPFGNGSSSYGNANVAAYLSSGNVSTDIETSANVSGNNLSFGNLYVGNTLFTRTLVVGTRTVPAVIRLASNNSFNVLTRTGNVTVYTT